MRASSFHLFRLVSRAPRRCMLSQNGWTSTKSWSSNGFKHASLGRSCYASTSHTGRGDVTDGSDWKIDETQYHHMADSTLNCLHDRIDEAELDFIDDISLEDGVLAIKLVNGSSFVINKHFATRQIWFASPVSGALYFTPKENGHWTCQARAQSDIVDVLSADLTSVCGESSCLGLDLTTCRA